MNNIQYILYNYENVIVIKNMHYFINIENYIKGLLLPLSINKKSTLYKWIFGFISPCHTFYLTLFSIIYILIK